MAAINLLPQDLVARSSIVKISGILGNIVTFGFAFFIIVAVGMGSLFIINSFRLKNLIQSQDALKANIKSLEATETRLVLVRDRVGKVKDVLDQESANNNLVSLDSLTQKIPVGVTLADAELSTKKSEMTFVTKDSLSLSQFMAELISANLYKSLDLTSFSFNPASGYSIGIRGQ